MKHSDAADTDLVWQIDNSKCIASDDPQLD
jgi:hypothetical protein